MNKILSIFLLLFTLSANAEQGVPVLMFHHINNQLPSSQTVVSVAQFEQYMELLVREGYNSITTSQLTDLITNKQNLPEKTIVLTFDDGWKDTLDAVPIMLKHNFTATFYVCSGLQNAPDYLSNDQIKLLSNHFEIGAHSHTHYVEWSDNLQHIDSRVLIGELLMSKKLIEGIIQKPVLSYAWPFGYYTADAIDYAKYIGFTSTVTVNGYSDNNINTSPLIIKRLTVDGRCTITQFKQMVNDKKTVDCQ